MDLAFLEETKFCLPARRSCRNPSPAFPSPCPTLPALFGTWWRNPSPSPWGGYAPSPLPLPAAASPCAISMPSPFLCRQSPYTALGVDVVQSQEQGPPDGGPCRVRCLFLGLVEPPRDRRSRSRRPPAPQGARRSPRGGCPRRTHCPQPSARRCGSCSPQC